MEKNNFDNWQGTLDFDLTHSGPFCRVLPGLAVAFDEEQMQETLAELLFGPPGSYSILSCEAGKAFFQPDYLCRMQYELKIRDEASGETFDVLVNARLFPDLAGARAFYEQRVVPLVDQMAGRKETQPFTHPAGLIEPLNMAVSVFPIDGQLPTLIEATDCDRLYHLLNRTLPDVVDGRFAIHAIRQEMAHYGRELRCVMRFQLEGEDLETHQPSRMAVYGKVDVDDQGSQTAALVLSMQALLQEPGVPYCFSIPQTLGYLPETHMLLMAALPGEPLIKRLNKQLEKGVEPVSKGITLDEAIAISARVLATLHSMQLPAGPRRSFSDEIAALQREIDVTRQVYPALGDLLHAWLGQINQHGQSSPAMPLCFSDGDYTNTQLLFDGPNAGLVDFDTACHAEPALDIGQFRAYQRLSFEKGHGSGDPALVQKNEQLCDLFLDTYLSAAGCTPTESALLRRRVAVYELTSLMHLVLHSWQKFKGSRLKLAMTMLEGNLKKLESSLQR